MTKYNAAPISELSIALQFGAKLPLTPNMALEIRSKLAAEYPRLEFRQPIGPLGAMPLPGVQVLTEAIDPRYWFSSEDEYFLVQIQNDLIALNWRKRNQPGQAAERPYPGFDEMLTRHRALVEMVLATLGVTDAPPVLGINLYYDNLWLLDTEKKQGASSFFKFWNTVGLKTGIGPTIQMAVAVDNPELGPMARVDVTAFVGAVLGPTSEALQVGKLVLSAVGQPAKMEDVSGAYCKLHSRVHEIFEKILTDELKVAWQ